MQDGHHSPNEGRHIPFKQEGWGIAAFICFLAIASALTAGYIHNKTYKHPTDVRYHAIQSSHAEN